MLIRRATIDIGSNSVLVLVADRDNGGPWRRVWETVEITSLGEGLTPGGELSHDAIARTVEAVRRFHRAASLHGADSISVVGTMALRTAANASELVNALGGEGIHVRVLSGDEEAHLSYASVAGDPMFSNQKGLVVVDIGGASTEVSTSKRTTSLPVGTMSVARDMLGPGPCESDAVFRAGMAIDEALSAAKWAARAMKVAVAVGATGVNLASSSAGLAAFDPDAVHGAELSRESVARAAADLCHMSVEDRANVAGLERERAPNIHAGALLLERVTDLLVIDSIRVSARGLRWGLLDEK